MKEIKEEIKRVEYITKYEAIDGTLFEDANECRKYENSARAVLLSRYKTLVINKFCEDGLFGVGSCDYDIDIVKVTDSEDIDLVLQLLILYNPHIEKDQERLTSYRKQLNTAMEDDDVVFIGRGYDDDSFYIIDSLINFLNKIVKKCDPGSKIKIEDDETIGDECN